MRSFAALAATAIVAMVLQTTVFPSVPVLPVAPDLMLVLAVYLGVFHRNMGGALGAFLLGYFMDAFSGVRLGVNAFVFPFKSAVYFPAAEPEPGQRLTHPQEAAS